MRGEREYVKVREGEKVDFKGSEGKREQVCM